VSEYIPELGQMAFGNPTGKYSCPDWMAGMLYAIGLDLSVRLSIPNPCKNVSAEYINDTFEMRSYCWDERDEARCALPNFKCGDFEVRWYKYCGRGMSINRPIDRAEFAEIFKKCVDSILRERRNDADNAPDNRP